MRLAAGLTTNMIANMGKGKHISMDTLTKIYETLDCGILDVIELVRDEEQTHESDSNRPAREAAAMGSTIPTRQLFSCLLYTSREAAADHTESPCHRRQL